MRTVNFSVTKLSKIFFIFFFLERLLGRANNFSAIPRKIIRIACKRSTLADLFYRQYTCERHLFTNEDITLWKSGQQKMLGS